MLESYLVWFHFNGEEASTNVYRFSADDENHAKEQLLDAEPGAIIDHVEMED